MGQFAKKLLRRMASKAGSLPAKEPKRRPGKVLPGGIKDVATLIEEGLDPIHVAKKTESSRTGIYGDIGTGGSHIRLREFITNDSLTCHCPTGYVGTAGQLRYVRLLPSLEP